MYYFGMTNTVKSSIENFVAPDGDSVVNKERSIVTCSVCAFVRPAHVLPIDRLKLHPLLIISMAACFYIHFLAKSIILDWF